LMGFKKGHKRALRRKLIFNSKTLTYNSLVD
jgi:hypothetical protein